MGWKTLKQYFKIEHLVTVENDCINIGSGYIHDLVVINTKTGRVVENSTFDGFLNKHYPELKNSSKDKILKLINAKDVFLKSLPVYTYTNDGEILEKYCEELGYPNVTHDGLLMYENTFSEDKCGIVERAKSELEIAVQWAEQGIEKAKNELAQKYIELALYKANLQKLTEKHQQNTILD